MDVAELKARARAARVVRHTFDGLTFEIRTPSTIEALRLVNAVNEKTNSNEERGLLTIEGVLDFVVGWEGVTVGHILSLPPGAQEYADAAPFDRDLLVGFIADRLDLGDRISGAVFGAINARREALEAEKKV